MKNNVCLYIYRSVNQLITRQRALDNNEGQPFSVDKCNSCISLENGGFDVRWVRFPNHISLFSTLSQLEFVGSCNSSDLVKRVAKELAVDATVKDLEAT